MRIRRSRFVATAGMAGAKKRRGFAVRRLAKAWVALFLLCGATAIHAAELAAVKVARAHAVVARYDHPGEPGGAVGVFDLRTGKWLVRTSFGLADLERRQPNRPDTAFEVASVTKQFTAASVAIAASQGYFALDDDIRVHVPEMPRFGEVITVVDLVHHVSGLRDDVWLRELTGRPNRFTSRQDIIALYARQKGTNFPPRTQYLYSNSGYLLLALIVERTTRQTLQQFAHRVIFGPLGMRHSRFQADTRGDNVARPYDLTEGGWKQSALEPASTFGPGGLFTTLDDYALWARNLFAADGKLAGGSALTRSLMQPAALQDGTRVPYGFGLELAPYRGVEMVAHGGADAGYRSAVMMFPSRGFGVIALANNGVDQTPMVNAIADVFLELPAVGASAHAGADMEAGVSAPRAAGSAETGIVQNDFSRFAGTYLVPGLGCVARVEANDRGVTIDNGFIYPQSRQFQPVAGLELVNDKAETAIFGTSPEGVTTLAIDIPTLGEAMKGYRKADFLVPTAGYLAAFAGDYFSEELQVVYRVTPTREGLALQFLGADADARCTAAAPCMLSPTVLNDFSSIGDRLSLMFTAPAAGRSEGFELTAQAGWVRGVKFVRVGH